MHKIIYEEREINGKPSHYLAVVENCQLDIVVAKEDDLLADLEVLETMISALRLKVKALLLKDKSEVANSIDEELKGFKIFKVNEGGNAKTNI